MAGADGIASLPVERLLERNAPEFDFFQAVRRLECASPDKPRIGKALRAADEAVRFCQQPSLAFAPGAVHHYEPATETRKARLVVNFLGLLGPNGPMPLHVTEYVFDRMRNHGDRTLAAFLDVFHHRILSLFYRAWACNRQSVSYDRPDQDRFFAYVASLCGRGDESFQGRDAAPDVAKLHFSGYLGCQTHHADGLRYLLEDYFGIKTEIEEFVGQWISLPDASLCRLGASRENGMLGSSVVVGAKFWDCQQRFRIRMGPMGLPDYERLLPTGGSFLRLRAWLRNALGDELSWEVQLVLRAGEVPPTRLGGFGRLGWSVWLQSAPPEKDADKLVLSSERAFVQVCAPQSP
jgi:type VI secretion system protein ImpH